MIRKIIYIVLSFLTLYGCGDNDDSTKSGADKKSAYEELQKKDYAIQVPDQTHNTTHITIGYDGALKKDVYRFKIHVMQDDDPSTDKTDRQRCEIYYGANPTKNRAFFGDTMTSSWKFRLPYDIKTTWDFCHVHQLISNKGNMPLLTFTPRTTYGKEVFEVKYHDRFSDTVINWASKDLSLFKGKWVTVNETCKFGYDGSYKLIIKDYNTGETLIDIEKNNVDMWRDVATSILPKWGIYRSIGTDGSLRNKLKDEIVCFADISVAISKY